jgi:hypothetical protein
MPFANKQRRVTGLLKHFGQRNFFKRQLHPHLRWQKLSTQRRPRNKRGNLQPCRVSSGEQGGARRRATHMSRVAIGEPHPFGSEPIEAGRFVKLAAVATYIGPREIIGENDDDVRWPALATGLPCCTRFVPLLCGSERGSERGND